MGALCPPKRNLSKQIRSQDAILNFLDGPHSTCRFGQSISHVAFKPWLAFPVLVPLACGSQTVHFLLSLLKEHPGLYSLTPYEIRWRFNRLSTFPRYFQYGMYFSPPQWTLADKEFSSGFTTPSVKNSFSPRNFILEKLCRKWQLV